MFCTGCGKEVAEGEKFCKACGLPVEGAPPTVEPVQAQQQQPWLEGAAPEASGLQPAPGEAPVATPLSAPGAPPLPKGYPPQGYAPLATPQPPYQTNMSADVPQDGEYIKGNIIGPRVEEPPEEREKTPETNVAQGKSSASLELEKLTRELKDQNMKVRRKAAMALGNIDDIQAVGPLIEALKDEDVQTRRAVAIALGKIGDPRAVEPLTEARKDSNWQVRAMTKEALKKINVDANTGDSMPSFNIFFKDQVQGKTVIKSKWDISVPGRISVTNNGLDITAQSRLSSAEKSCISSAEGVARSGIVGELLVKPFFQAARTNTRTYLTNDILKVVAQINHQAPTSDTVTIAVQKTKGGNDIYCFSLSSRVYLLLLWGFLNKLVPNEKLVINPLDLKELLQQEAQISSAEELQSKIARGFFNAIPSSNGGYKFLNDISNLFGNLFGSSGLKVASEMLTSENPYIRTTAELCCAKIG
jgi:hypothetical protein